jgi:S-DNA-T family DNA segregation ATPase FtsK/SpoIIIE
MPRYIDLTKMPHLLVAGQTGSGKSVFLNTLILSILYLNLPAQCRLILVDPKRVEMAAYRGIPHLMRPVVTDAQEAMLVFSWLVDEMERRYRVLETNHVRNIDSYNALQNGTMPYIVAVVDEMADLMMTSGKYLESMIVRLAQLARAVGIHLVLATQKPIVKVITGLIKSNMSTRIAFAVSSKMDSRVILDVNGAEHLAGKGDMLMLAPGMQEPERFHGAWVSDEEIQAVAKRITIGG